MKKLTFVATIFLLLGLVLSACGGAQTNQQTPGAPGTPGLGTQAFGTSTPLALPGTAMATSVATSAPTATEAPTFTSAPTDTPAATPTQPVGTPSGTAVLPSTGAANPALLSKLLEYPVLDQSGEALGEANNMVLNLGTQHVDYLVLAAGDVLGIGDKLVVIPWSALTVRTGAGNQTPGTPAVGVVTGTVTTTVGTANQNAIVVNVDKQVLTSAPNFDANALPDVTTAGWDTDILDFWKGQPGIQLPSPAVTSTQTMTSTTPMTTTTTVTGTVQTAPLKGDILASDFRGFTVQNNNGDDIAEVKDAVVNTQTGDMQYIVVASGGFLGIGEKLILVPPQAFQLGPNAKTLVLNVSQDDLTKAPNFDLNQLPDMTGKDWDAQIRAYWNQIIH